MAKNDFIVRFDVPLNSGPPYPKCEISTDPEVIDLADLDPADHDTRDLSAKMEALERYRGVIRDFRSNLRVRDYWQGHIVFRDLFAAGPNLSVHVTAMDLGIIASVELTTRDGLRDRLIGFLRIAFRRQTLMLYHASFG